MFASLLSVAGPASHLLASPPSIPVFAGHQLVSPLSPPEPGSPQERKLTPHTGPKCLLSEELTKPTKCLPRKSEVPSHNPDPDSRYFSSVVSTAEMARPTLVPVLRLVAWPTPLTVPGPVAQLTPASGAQQPSHDLFLLLG